MEYWNLNFNDFTAGLVTLFTALHVNNVYVTSSGFESVLSTYSPRLFFAAWHCASVLFLLNLIPAFFLSNFWKYYIAINSDDNSDDPEEHLKGSRVVGSEIEVHRQMINRMTEASKVSNLIRVSQKETAEVFISSTPCADTKFEKDSIHRASLKTGEEETNRISSAFLRPSQISLWAEEALDESAPRSTMKMRNTTTRGSSFRDNEAWEKYTPRVTLEMRSSTIGVSCGEIDVAPSLSNTEKASFMDERNSSSAPHVEKNAISVILTCWGFDRIKMDRIVLAAILVQLAKDGLKPSLFTSELASSCYFTKKRIDNLLLYASRVLLLLCCFLRPHWTYRGVFDNWRDDSIYPKTGIFLDHKTGMTLCVLLLIFIFFGLCLEFVYSFETEKVLKSADLYSYVAAAEGATAESALPFPLTEDDVDSLRSSVISVVKQPKCFTMYSTETNRGSASSWLNAMVGVASAERSQSRRTLIKKSTDKEATYTFVTPFGESNTLSEMSLSAYFDAIILLVGNRWFWRIILILSVFSQVIMCIFALRFYQYTAPIVPAIGCIIWFDYNSFRQARLLFRVFGR